MSSSAATTLQFPNTPVFHHVLPIPENAVNLALKPRLFLNEDNTSSLVIGSAATVQGFPNTLQQCQTMILTPGSAVAVFHSSPIDPWFIMAGLAPIFEQDDDGVAWLHIGALKRSVPGGKVVRGSLMYEGRKAQLVVNIGWDNAKGWPLLELTLAVLDKNGPDPVLQEKLRLQLNALIDSLELMLDTKAVIGQLQGMSL